MPLSTADIIEVNSALEEAKGDRAIAAASLGMEHAELGEIIKDCDQLKCRWSPDALHTLPPEIGTIDRDAPLEQFFPMPAEDQPTEAELALAKAMENEDRKFKRGLESMGLSPKQLQRAIALQQFGRTQFRQSIELTVGGINSVALNILEQIDLVSERLAEVRGKLFGAPDPQLVGMVTWDPRRALVEEEESLARTYRDLTDQFRRILDTQGNTAKILALIRFKGKGGEMKRMKPAFSAVTEMAEEA